MQTKDRWEPLEAALRDPRRSECAPHALERALQRPIVRSGLLPLDEGSEIYAGPSSIMAGPARSHTISSGSTLSGTVPPTSPDSIQSPPPSHVTVATSLTSTQVEPSSESYFPPYDYIHDTPSRSPSPASPVVPDMSSLHNESGAQAQAQAAVQSPSSSSTSTARSLLPPQNSTEQQLEQLALMRAHNKAKAAEPAAKKTRAPRSCPKCGRVEDCVGRQASKRCPYPCRDCGQKDCRGRNSKRKDKPCWEAWD